jgi:ABC-type glycerol-3-phosphate transport system substrate-binding protein
MFKKTSFICLLAFLLISCGGNKTALIWTDRPEFALYGEYFNNVHKHYKVTVRYYEFPSVELDRLNRRGEYPDVVIGSWLKNSSTSTHFKTLNGFFGPRKLVRNNFYPRLLSFGRIDRGQYLLPVSFNVPALIFAKEMEADLSNPFVIGFDEIKNLSRGYNIETRGSYTRMGFSPLWSDDFLMVTSFLFGASFREASPLAWDSEALERSMNFVYAWTHDINTDNQMEEDFTFKYFFEPPERLIQSGRILFSYMESDDLFILNEETKNTLDFRWIMDQSRIPVIEDTVFLGIPKRGKSKKAAKDFVLWLFQVENQRLLLEYSKSNRISETVFGICGGFSTLSPVTEQIFPRYYTNLLGRMPPAEYLSAPNLLPENWSIIKERVVLPYLRDRARNGAGGDTLSLERRLSDWMRVNR